MAKKLNVTFNIPRKAPDRWSSNWIYFPDNEKKPSTKSLYICPGWVMQLGALYVIHHEAT